MMDFPRQLLELHAAEHRAMRRRGISGYRPTMYGGPPMQHRYRMLRKRMATSDGAKLRAQVMAGALQGGMGMAGLGSAGDKLCGNTAQVIANIIGAAGNVAAGVAASGSGSGARTGKAAGGAVSSVTNQWLEGCANRTIQDQTQPAVGSGASMDTIFQQQQQQLNALARQNQELQTAVLTSQQQQSAGIDTRQLAVGGAVVVGALALGYLLLR